MSLDLRSSMKGTPIYNLHNDALNLIFEALEPQSALLAANRTCRLFYIYTTPFLYRSLTLRRSFATDVSTAYVLRRLTSPGSQLPNFIHSLRFLGWGFATRGLFMAAPYEDELCSLACTLLSRTGKHLSDVYWEDYPSAEIFTALSIHHPNVRLHITAARIADAWPRMWPALSICHNQLTSLTLHRLGGIETSVRDVLRASPHLLHISLSNSSLGQPMHPLSPQSLHFPPNSPVPRPISLSLHNSPLSAHEIDAWTLAGGFDRLAHLTIDVLRSAGWSDSAFVAVAASSLRSLVLTDPISLSPTAHLAAFLARTTALTTLHLPTSLEASAAPLHQYITRPAAALLRTLHLHAPEPRRLGAIRTVPYGVAAPAPALSLLAASFPALRELGLDLNWIPARLFDGGAAAAPAGSAVDVAALDWAHLQRCSAQFPALRRLVLYAQATERLCAPRAAADSETAPPPRAEPRVGPALCRAVLRGVRAGVEEGALRELVVRRGSMDLDYGRGCSRDQCQAIWERNNQRVFRCWVEGGGDCHHDDGGGGEGGDDEGDIRIVESGFEDVYGRCDTRPNVVRKEGWTEGEVGGLEARSFYDQVQGA